MIPADSAVSPPRANGELVFEAPWEGRAFGLVTATMEHMAWSWDELRDLLVAEIGSEPSAPYYESWVGAFEALLARKGVAHPGAGV